MPPKPSWPIGSRTSDLSAKNGERPPVSRFSERNSEDIRTVNLSYRFRRFLKVDPQMHNIAAFRLHEFAKLLRVLSSEEVPFEALGIDGIGAQDKNVWSETQIGALDDELMQSQTLSLRPNCTGRHSRPSLSERERNNVR